jgi:hypothetical protein
MEKLEKIHTARLALATAVAAALYFVFDGVIHGAILGEAHAAAITAAGKPLTHDPTSYAYFAAYDLGKAFVALAFYAVGRVALGAGRTTGLYAGLVAWLAVEALPAIAAMPIPFYGKTFHLQLLSLELVPVVLGALVGCWLYERRASAATAPARVAG